MRYSIAGWQQRLKGRYAYDGGDSSVVINRNFLGYYKMTLVATGNGVGVERIR